MSLHALASCAAAAAALALPLTAQAGGFVPGDLILHSPAIQGISSSDGAIVRIDPVTGQVTMLLDLIQTQFSHDAIAYDPFRDRLLFCGGFTGVSMPKHLYALDGAGNAVDLGLGSRSLDCMAPAFGGRVYFHDVNANFTSPIRYIDSDNVEHVLMDASGSTPWLMPTASFDLQAMEYDAPTHSLLLASSSAAIFACSGGDSVGINVRKLDLSADGSRVVAPEACAQFTVNPSGGVRPVGLTRMPSGQYLITVDDNSNSAHPRMVLLGTAPLAMSAFASNGSYLGAAATNAGVYSSVRGQVVVLDTLNDFLRAFSPGGSGNGTVITPSSQISGGGSSGEVATLMEIPLGGCGLNNVALYCTAKVTSGGCTPVITTSGGPSASASSGFEIRAAQIEPVKPGLFFYGLSGPANAPFQGGFLCVQPPTRRTSIQSSGGAAACSGTYAFDFNAWIASGADPFVGAGSAVNGQYWFRDPASPSTTGLSAGVAFVVCP